MTTNAPVMKRAHKRYSDIPTEIYRVQKMRMAIINSSMEAVEAHVFGTPDDTLPYIERLIIGKNGKLTPDDILDAMVQDYISSMVEELDKREEALRQERYDLGVVFAEECKEKELKQQEQETDVTPWFNKSTYNGSEKPPHWMKEDEWNDLNVVRIKILQIKKAMPDTYTSNSNYYILMKREEYLSSLQG